MKVERIISNKNIRKRICILAGMCILTAIVAAIQVNVSMMNKKLEKYNSITDKSILIPDISQGFIPQGIAYDQDSGYIFLTGYMGNGSASPIYIMDPSTGELIKKILMYDPAGKPFKGHAGGISAYNGELYVAGSTNACMYVFDIEELLEADNLSKVQYAKEVGLRMADDFIRVSFTAVDDELLYAGEYHKSPLFYTDEDHAIKNSDGVHKAYLLGFEVDENYNAIPKKVYSIPDSVQGACFKDGYVFLSISRGFAPSDIAVYRLDDVLQVGMHEVLGVEVPLYILDSSVCSKMAKVPLMSEEIITIEDKLLLISESASNRYLIGKSLGMDKIAATPIDYFLNP